MRRLPNPASLTTDQRHAHRLAMIGKHADTFEHLDDGTMLATGLTARGFYLAAFLGKALRPEPRLWGNYKSDADRAACIERIKKGRTAHAQARATRRAERSRPHSLNIGDVLFSSWGYEQTNVDFYEVVAVRGAVIDMRELAKDSASTGHMTGCAVPVRGQYVSDVQRSKRPSPDNRVRLTSFSSAAPWDGLPKSWSSYA